MKTRLFTTTLLLLAFFSADPSSAKVYKNKRVGSFDRSYDLRDYDGTLLNFMKEMVYPALAEEADNVTGNSRDFLGAIERGEGVEIKLTDDVSTVHIKYKNPFDTNAERSGRSFGMVGAEGSRYRYVADASYAHFLRTLEKLSLNGRDELEDFYRAILYVVANSDTSHMERLNQDAQQVAADFVAVYVAEQYRHLINGKDRRGNRDKIGRARLGRGHNWDDAHLQVTLLAAFHAGQSSDMRYMVYEGAMTNEVYDQNACLYKRFEDPKRDRTKKRPIRLKDYWQFSFRSTCPGRSGVNLTRSDFQEMGRDITQTLASTELGHEEAEVVGELAEMVGGSSRAGLVERVSEFFVSNSAPSHLPNDGEELVEGIIDFLMVSYDRADDITGYLIH